MAINVQRPSDNKIRIARPPSELAKRRPSLSLALAVAGRALLSWDP